MLSSELKVVSFFFVFYLEWICAINYIDHVTTSTNGSLNFILNRGDKILSTSGLTKLAFQDHDGNFVLYNVSPLWSTQRLGVDGNGNLLVELDSSGNLMVKDIYYDIVWQSNTGGHTLTQPHHLIVDEACAYIMDSTNTVLWDQGDGCNAPYPTLFPPPSSYPTQFPTPHPTTYPSLSPTQRPTLQPTLYPSQHPTQVPTLQPIAQPTLYPSQHPTQVPTLLPTAQPTFYPSYTTQFPTAITSYPTLQPTDHTTMTPTSHPGTDVVIVAAHATDPPQTSLVSSKLMQPDTSKSRNNESVVVSVFVVCSVFVVILNVIVVYFYVKGKKTNKVDNTVEIDKLCMEKDATDLNVVSDDNGKEMDVRRQAQILVMRWLTEIVQLPQYYGNFLENGYDDMEFVQDISEKSELADIGVNKVGHQVRILAKIQLRNKHLVPSEHELDEDTDISSSEEGDNQMKMIAHVQMTSLHSNESNISMAERKQLQTDIVPSQIRIAFLDECPKEVCWLVDGRVSKNGG
eukprot:599358_1